MPLDQSEQLFTIHTPIKINASETVAVIHPRGKDFEVCTMVALFVCVAMVCTMVALFVCVTMVCTMVALFVCVTMVCAMVELFAQTCSY